MAQQAFVTLTALTGGLIPSVRRLELNPKQVSVPIGRASKSVQKGLVGAENNAWFDSPVMSREHAELTLDEDTMCVTIQDVMSMHGTSVNGAKISPNVPRQLNKLDRLEFGTSVRRGPEEFPACEFEIDWDIRQWTPRFTVSVPESSDVEEIDDSEEEEDHLSPTTPYESPIRKPADTIDLTKDDSEDEVEEMFNGPQGLSSEDIARDRTAMMINLAVGEVEEEFESDDIDLPYHISELIQGDLTNTDTGADPQRLNIGEKQVSLFDSSSESGSDKENEDEIEISDEVSFHMGWNVEADVESNQESNDGCFVSDSPEPQSQEFALYDNIPVSYDTSIPELKPASFEVASSEPNFGFNFGRTPHTPSFDGNEGILESNLRTSITPISGKYQPADIIMFTGSGSMLPTENSTQDHHARHSVEVTGENISAVDKANERQPSPSDAAMVKPSISLPTPKAFSFSVPSIHQNPTHLNPVPVHHMPASDWQVFTSKTFADLPQKQEFFQAREQNRATLSARVPSVQNDSRRSTVALPSLQRFAQSLESDNNGNFGASTEPVNPVQPGVEHINIDDFSNGISVHNEELDMTSAVAYNKSKAAKDHRAILKSKSKQLSNDVVIESAPSQVSTRSLKRKSDEISDVLGDEVHSWGAAKPISSDGHSTKEIALVPASVSDAQRDGKEYTTTILGRESPDRSHDFPQKRVKRFAENLGYAALGGVAAVAGLFSVLVATAPEFL